MTSWAWGDFATWGATLLSAVSLILAVVASRSAARNGERTRALEERNVKLMEAQTQLSHQAWTDEYFRDVTLWANDVAETIARAIHLCAAGSPTNQEILYVRSRLSAALDTGRWYFPNDIVDEFGKEKPPAYRGYRQNVLDWVFRAYDVFSHPTHYGDTHSALVQAQRHFVSEIQVVLDPRARGKTVERVLQEFRGVGTEQIAKPESNVREGVAK